MIKHGMFNTRRGKAHYYNDNQNNKNKNKRTLQRKKAQVYLQCCSLKQLKRGGVC